MAQQGPCVWHDFSRIGWEREVDGTTPDTVALWESLSKALGSRKGHWQKEYAFPSWVAVIGWLGEIMPRYWYWLGEVLWEGGVALNVIDKKKKIERRSLICIFHFSLICFCWCSQYFFSSFFFYNNFPFLLLLPWHHHHHSHQSSAITISSLCYYSH